MPTLFYLRSTVGSLRSWASRTDGAVLMVPVGIVSPVVPVMSPAPHKQLDLIEAGRADVDHLGYAQPYRAAT